MNYDKGQDKAWLDGLSSAENVRETIELIEQAQKHPPKVSMREMMDRAKAKHEFEKQFNMTEDEERKVELIIKTTMTEDEIADLWDTHDKVNEFLKAQGILITNGNACAVMRIARQTLEQDYGWQSLEESLEAFAEAVAVEQDKGE